MAWRELSVLDQRREFVMLRSLVGANILALCKRFGISWQTGYVWLRRSQAGEAVQDRSRRPHSSPRRTPDDVERHPLCLRDEFLNETLFSSLPMLD